MASCLSFYFMYLELVKPQDITICKTVENDMNLISKKIYESKDKHLVFPNKLSDLNISTVDPWGVPYKFNYPSRIGSLLPFDLSSEGFPNRKHGPYYFGKELNCHELKNYTFFYWAVFLLMSFIIMVTLTFKFILIKKHNKSVKQTG